MKQLDLFETQDDLPHGVVYVRDFISAAEENALLEEIAHLPLREARYRQYTAKRRIASYGQDYDFSTKELVPAMPIPEFLYELRDRFAALADIPSEEFAQSVIAEYQTGTQLGWHRDVPEFEVVAGVSLLGPARMRMRRYPPERPAPRRTPAIVLEPRSAYIIRGEARWCWQHSIPPTKNTRYSITFRTRSPHALQVGPPSNGLS
jgi:alkylated DNA repair dioxygenase AlkB